MICYWFFFWLFFCSYSFGIETGYYRIKHENKYLDIQQSDKDAKFYARLKEEKQTRSQLWHVEKLSNVDPELDGHLVITCLINNNKALDDESEKAKIDAKIVLYKKHLLRNQLFNYEDGLIKSIFNPLIVFSPRPNGEVVLDKFNEKLNQTWSFIPVEDPTLTTMLGAKLSTKFKEFFIEISSDQKLIKFELAVNENDGDVKFFKDDKLIGSGQSQKFSHKFESTLQAGVYKFTLGSRIMQFHLKENIEEISGDLKFKANIDRMISDIIFNSETSDTTFSTCYQNQNYMNIRKIKKTETGNEEISFSGVFAPENDYKCDLKLGKSIYFSFLVRDVMPSITDFSMAIQPYYEVIKLYCSGLSHLTLADITLYYNNTVLLSNKNATTIAHSIKKSENGWYKCKISNAYGFSQINIQVERRKSMTNEERLGANGGVLNVHLKPYVEQVTITSTFDSEENLHCQHGRANMPRRKYKFIESFDGQLGFECRSNYGDRFVYYANV